MTYQARRGLILLLLSGLLTTTLTGCSFSQKKPVIIPMEMPEITKLQPHQFPRKLYLQHVQTKLVDEAVLQATESDISFDEGGNVLIRGKPFAYPLNVEFADVCFDTQLDSKAMNANWLDSTRS